jgi:hypothetical protein
MGCASGRSEHAGILRALTDGFVLVGTEDGPFEVSGTLRRNNALQTDISKARRLPTRDILQAALDKSDQMYGSDYDRSRFRETLRFSNEAIVSEMKSIKDSKRYGTYKRYVLLKVLDEDLPNDVSIPLDMYLVYLTYSISLSLK